MRVPTSGRMNVTVFDTERRMLRALAAIVGVVLFGTVGFMWFEGWDFWQSLFFTLITITTVGYGDYGLSVTGERFTAILLLFGIGVATYAVGQFAQALIDHHLGWERKMHQKIAQIKDHYIVCGLGRMGVAVCDRLAEGGIPFVAVDSDREAVEAAIRRGCIAVEGDATDDETLDTLGLARARGIACLTNSDTENIVITLSARQLCPELTIISRAEQDSAVRKIIRAGATRVISPISRGGASVAQSIINPNLADLLDSGQSDQCDIHLAETTIEDGCALQGRTVREYGMDHPSLVFVAIKTSDGPTQLRPGANHALAAGEVLIVAGDTDELARLHCDAHADAGAKAA